MTKRLACETISEHYLECLRSFVAMRSIAGNPKENARAVGFVCALLHDAGFECRVEGEQSLEQPVIVARRSAVGSNRKMMLYGHYDVAPVKKGEQWSVDDPFMVTRLDGRLYGRGVADNKGTLLTRLLVLKELHLAGKPLPEICWLIQGQEEVEPQCHTTAAIFKREVALFPADVFVDETGFNDLDKKQAILFLWSPAGPFGSPVEEQVLSRAVGIDRVDQRHLNKFNGGENCPLLGALPQDARYVGFGPNDRRHNIHRINESLDESLLAQHQKQFGQFLSRYALS